MRSSATSTTALLLLLAVASAIANPEQGQTFRDWTARCETPPGAKRERCYIFQNIVHKESGQRLLHVAVGYLAMNARPAAVLTLPLGISLPPGVELSVDGGDALSVDIERCDTSGCIGLLALDDDLIAAMKSGRQARITFHDGARRRIGVPVSLMGFTAGFESLEP